MKRTILQQLFFLSISITIIPAEVVTIYATESAEYRGNDDYCCSFVETVQNNSTTIWSRGCWVYGVFCGVSLQAAIWTFDISNIPDGSDIQSISFKGNAPYEWGSPSQQFSISNETGNITSSLGYTLWNDSDWSIDNFNWNGHFSQTIPASVFESIMWSGQLNVLAFDGFSLDGLYVQNSGTNAPRLVIEYEGTVAPQTLIHPEHNSIVEFSNVDLEDVFYFEWEEAANINDPQYNFQLEGNLSMLPATLINNTTAAISFESVQYTMDSLGTQWLMGYWDVFVVSDGDTMESENGPFYVMFHSVTLSVDEDLTPKSITLHPAYPNPFNPTTTLRLEIGSRSISTPLENHDVSLQIFDITGRGVDILVKGRMVAGEHEIQWDASAHPSGVYFAVLQSGNIKQTKKLVLMK